MYEANMILPKFLKMADSLKYDTDFYFFYLFFIYKVQLNHDLEKPHVTKSMFSIN